MAKNQRKYSDQFKHQAVDLAKEIGMAAAERKLGVPHGNIRTWQSKIEAGGRVSKTDVKAPTMESLAEENRRLREELSKANKANIILKAAAAFFSQDHLK